MIIRLILILLIIFFANNAWSASDEFFIRTLVGGDSTPPTTPVLLSAVPTASSQIDLNWSASSDNFLLEGYVLFRDDVQIATTTLTSFNDTGLVPETLYTYKVYAFDSSFNVSTTSNSLSTTTLAIPVSPPTPTPEVTDDESDTTSIKIFSLRNINISTALHEAKFTWETMGVTRYILRWGKSNEYDGGYISNDVYRSSHETEITDLESNTQYFYELTGYTPTGISRVLNTGQFVTKKDVNNFPPPNVMRLSAVIEGEDVLLSWQVPSFTSIKTIRVLGNHYGYPADINDGEVIYEGLSNKAIDRTAFKDFDYKYYSVFVITDDGLVSSGAVVFVQKKNSVNDNLLPNKNYPDSTTSSIPDNRTDLDGISLHDFNSENIKIFQDDQIFDFGSDRINLSYQKPFTISIPYDSVPRHLKTIVVTLLDPTDNRRSYSFLLRINKDGTAYESTVASLNVLGASRLQVEIFDFESQLIGLYRKQIDFSVKADKDNNQEVFFPDKIIEYIQLSIPLLTSIILFVVLLALFIWRRNRVEDK